MCGLYYSLHIVFCGHCIFVERDDYVSYEGSVANFSNEENFKDHISYQNNLELSDLEILEVGILRGRGRYIVTTM